MTSEKNSWEELGDQIPHAKELLERHVRSCPECSTDELCPKGSLYLHAYWVLIGQQEVYFYNPHTGEVITWRLPGRYWLCYT